MVVLTYHWAAEKKLNYASSLVLLSIGTYVSFSVIPALLNGLSIFLKLLAIFKRVNEVLTTEDKHSDNEIKND